MLIIIFRRTKVGNSGSRLNNKKYGEKNEIKACRLNLYPITYGNHGSLNPNLDYGLYGDHTFANPTSPFAPFVWLTRLPQDGLVKSCDD
jgi:hypothetical protein